MYLGEGGVWGEMQHKPVGKNGCLGYETTALYFTVLNILKKLLLVGAPNHGQEQGLQDGMGERLAAPSWCDFGSDFICKVVYCWG